MLKLKTQTTSPPPVRELTVTDWEALWKAGVKIPDGYAPQNHRQMRLFNYCIDKGYVPKELNPNWYLYGLPGYRLPFGVSLVYNYPLPVKIIDAFQDLQRVIGREDLSYSNVFWVVHSANPTLGVIPESNRQVRGILSDPFLFLLLEVGKNLLSFEIGNWDLSLDLREVKDDSNNSRG